MGLPSDILSAVMPWSVIECVPLTVATLIYEVEIVHFLFFSGKSRPTSPRDSPNNVPFLPWPVPETPRSWQGVLATWIYGVIWFFSELTLDLALILISSEDDLRALKAERLKREKARSKVSPKKRSSEDYGLVPDEGSHLTPNKCKQPSEPRDKVQADAQERDTKGLYQNAPVVEAAAKDEIYGTQDEKAISAETQYKESYAMFEPLPQATAISQSAAQPSEDNPESVFAPSIDHSQSVNELVFPGSKAKAGSNPSTANGPSCELAADTTDTVDTTSESEATRTIETRARSPRGRAKARKLPEPRPRLMVPLLKAVQLVQSPPGAPGQHYGYDSCEDNKSLSPTTGESSETSSNNGEHSETMGAEKAKKRNKKKNKSKKRSKSSPSTSPDACSTLNEPCNVSTSAALLPPKGRTHSEQEIVAAMDNGDVKLAFAPFTSRLGHSREEKRCSVDEDWY
ncbi:unnamed protein product [Mortierella alpina]